MGRKTVEDKKTCYCYLFIVVHLILVCFSALTSQFTNAKKHMDQYKQIATSCEEALADANEVILAFFRTKSSLPIINSVSLIVYINSIVVYNSISLIVIIIINSTA